MSASEDTTVTAQPDHHQQQQNVPPSGASTSSSASALTVASSPLAATATTKAVSPTVTTSSDAAAAATGSGDATTAPTASANNGSNSIHSGSGEIHSSKEATSSSCNITASDGDNNSTPGAVINTTDASSSSNPDKAPAGASSPMDDVGSDAASREGPTASAQNVISIEPGSSGGTSTPIAAASPVSVTSTGGEDVPAAKTTLSGSGAASMDDDSTVTPVANGAVASDSAAPLLSCTSSTLRDRETADKTSLEYHCRRLEEELQSVKESEAKIKQQYSESQRRERILARRLVVKEQEMQDYASQVAELKAAQAPGPAALRSALLDPAVNILFQKLKAELQATKAKLEETQNELSAWKFTPDSNTGKRLMAKCRLLYQENEELGKMTSNGRLAKLESELALQKSYNEEVKKSQLELDDFLQELDEDVEGMQGAIVLLQQELKQTKESRDELEKEVIQLRSYMTGNLGQFSGSTTNPATSGSTPTDERSSSMMLMMDTHDSNSNSNSHGHGHGHGHSVYHHPDGGGPDCIGGDGGGSGEGGIGDMGGGVTPIYLVNGGGTGAIGADSRLVKQSSSSGDQELMVYSNRTHCGGVVTNSNELRTTPTAGSGGSLAAASGSGADPASSSSSTSSSINIGTAAVNGGGTAGSTVVTGSGDPVVNELNPSLPSGGAGDDGNGRTSGSTAGSNSSAGVDNSVHSTSGSGAANKQHPPQQSQQSQPQQPQQQQQRTSNNGGRNGGRTTVAARKRNYNETEIDSAEVLPNEGNSAGGGVVGDAYGSDSVGGVLTVDVGVSESSASAGVANGKLLNAVDGSLLSEQPDNEPNSNKRMTRSGKGKVVAPATATSTTSSSSSSSSASSSSATSNVLMTSAAKKLRRGSVAPEDESDPLGDAQPPPAQQQQQPPPPQPHLHHPQQTISSANGST